MGKINVKIASLIFSISASLGIIFEWFFLTGNKQIGAGLFSIILFIFFYRIYSIILSKKYSTRFYFFYFILSLLFSLMLCVGAELDSKLNVNKTIFIVSIIGCFFALFPLIKIVTEKYLMQNITVQSQKEKASLRLVNICFIVICISWLCVYLALFPGVYAIDAPTWYLEFATGRVTSQWSPVIAGFFYLCIRLGEQLFNSSTIGMAIYSACQMSFSLFAVWEILRFLHYNVAKKWSIIATLFFSIIPVFAILAVSAAQDAWFMSLFALCILELVQYSMDPKLYVKNKKNSLRLFVLLLMLCICRNNGLYSLLVLLIIMLFICREIKLWLVVGAVIVTMLFYQGPVLNAFNVDTSTTVREMLSIPLQQMAYAYKNKENALSDNDRTEMLKYAKAESWENDLTGISDTIKNGFNTEKFQEDPGEFISLYVRIGGKAPKDYLKGLLYQTIGLWYPEKHYSDPQIWHPYINIQSYDVKLLDYWKSSVDIKQQSLFPAGLKVLQYLFGWKELNTGYGGDLIMHFSDIPIFSLLCKMGIYFWMIIYLFLFAIVTHKKLALIPIGLAIGLSATIFLSPVMYFRYYAPVMFASPILIWTVACARNQIQ